MSKKDKKERYEADLLALQTEWVETQAWMIETGRRLLVLFEGRDAAGKDGAIKRITEFAAPRQTRVHSLPKPTERETTQWYFQRYVPHLPAAGETVLFNRSWYNRAGVEPVMGFCTPEQHERFLKDAPRFERLLAQDGIVLVKLWLDISREEQGKRLAERLEDPLKRFKVSSLDAEAQKRWSAYSDARNQMLAETHTPYAPWTVVATDDKKVARVEILRVLLERIDRPGRRSGAPHKDVVFPGDAGQGRLSD